MKKILYMCDFFNCIGGTEYYNYILISNLVKRNYEVLVLIGEKPINDVWIKKLSSINVKVAYPEKRCEDFVCRNIERQFIKEMEKQIYSWNPDIIYTNPAGKMIVTWLELYPWTEIPIVATEWTTPSENTAHWYPKELSKSINKIAAYIATCHKSALGLREYFGYKREIYEIPHIIQEVCPLSEEMYSMGNINSIGCVSRLSTEKGLVYLLGAWKYLVDSNKNATLHIYGDGSEKRYLAELIKALGINDSVFLEGTFEPISGIDYICKKHLIFVQPSLFESIPTTIIELMARGKVIISSDVGGVSEVICPKFNNGLLVNSASTDELYKAIKFLWDNPDLLKVMAFNARKIYEQKYNLDKNVNRIINILEKHSKKGVLYVTGCTKEEYGLPSN